MKRTRRWGGVLEEAMRVAGGVGTDDNLLLGEIDRERAEGIVEQP